MNSKIKISNDNEINNNYDACYMILVEDLTPPVITRCSSLPASLKLEDKFKGFRCEKCPARFYEKVHLVSHVSSCHQALEKRFQCPHCDRFSHESRFKVMKHIKKTHRPKYEFKCRFCKKRRFDSQTYLRLHLSVCPLALCNKSAAGIPQNDLIN